MPYRAQPRAPNGFYARVVICLAPCPRRLTFLAPATSCPVKLAARMCPRQPRTQHKTSGGLLLVKISPADGAASTLHLILALAPSHRNPGRVVKPGCLDVPSLGHPASRTSRRTLSKYLN